MERFAVAMLGFALHYDLDFRRNFLRVVCGCGKDVDPKLFKIEIEVAGCGDLILRTENNSEVYALEFKVGADLQDHNQSPRNREFFITGYGAGISRKYGKNSIYIVVQNERDDSFPPRCVSRSWNDVFKCPHDKSMIHDLFKSFGSLGIPEFIHMNTKHLTLGPTSLDALKLYELLQAVAGTIKFKRASIDAELEPNGKGGYIGLNIPAASASEKWKRLVQPDRSLGWFGYSHSDESSTLDVWFYCGKPEAAKQVSNVLKKRFPNAKTTTDAKNNVWLSFPANKSADDQEWFVSVFDSLVSRE